MKQPLSAQVALALLTLLAACGTTATRANAAPPFTVNTMGGGTFRLAAHRGKPVVVYFYASWCGTCVTGATNLAHFKAAHPNVAVLALDVDPSDTPIMVAQFRQMVPDATYLFALDPGGRTAQSYGVKALEESVVISPGGTLAFHNTTSPTLSLLDQELAKVTQG